MIVSEPPQHGQDGIFFREEDNNQVFNIHNSNQYITKKPRYLAGLFCSRTIHDMLQM